MADEKMRVVAFDTVDLDDGDWDGPTAHGEFLSYTSKHAAASIRVTKGGKVVLDGDYGARKTVLIDDDVNSSARDSEGKFSPSEVYNLLK